MKIKLYEIGNDGNFNWYAFDKKQQVAEYLSMILNKLFHTYWGFQEEYQNKKKKWITRIINIEKYKDYHQTVDSNKKIRVDIFYSDKKMFLTINCSQEDRLKFNEELFKIAEMPKLKKIKSKKKTKK